MARAEKEDKVELLKQLEKNANWAAVLGLLSERASAGTKPSQLEIDWARLVLTEQEKS